MGEGLGEGPLKFLTIFSSTTSISLSTRSFQKRNTRKPHPARYAVLSSSLETCSESCPPSSSLISSCITIAVPHRHKRTRSAHSDRTAYSPCRGARAGAARTSRASSPVVSEHVLNRRRAFVSTYRTACAPPLDTEASTRHARPPSCLR